MSKELKKICFIIFSLSEGKISKLKLNQLLYLIQAWVLSTRGIPAFNDDIEAWLFGPYTIKTDQEFSELQKEFKLNKKNNIKNKFREEIEFIYSQFGEWDSGKLINLIHQYEPWINAWKRKNQVITPKEINNYHVDRCNSKGNVF